MQWIHEPVLNLVDGGIRTPRRLFNLFNCYRIFTSFRPTDTKEKREDVLAPSWRVCENIRHKKEIVQTPSIRVFYEGAEEDLDRYLLWLHSVFLSHEDDDSAPIYVAKQTSHEVQTELAKLYPAAQVYFVGPNELDHYGLLAGPTKNMFGIGLY